MAALMHLVFPPNAHMQKARQCTDVKERWGFVRWDELTCFTDSIMGEKKRKKKECMSEIHPVPASGTDCASRNASQEWIWSIGLKAGTWIKKIIKRLRAFTRTHNAGLLVGESCLQMPLWMRCLWTSSSADGSVQKWSAVFIFVYSKAHGPTVTMRQIVLNVSKHYNQTKTEQGKSFEVKSYIF